ncbi:hypothetical protein ACUTJJ_05475 [Agrobacterium sp. DKPNP3]|uniref:hypothetical protein n=1 Tax=Agrobacterium sp. DKPNP3 TaxID=3457323 RepID=UPI004044944B
MSINEDDDPRFAYLEWLAIEARLLRIELYGDEYWADKQLTPCGTFAGDFHVGQGDWRDRPQPSTRAELVLRTVGAMPKYPAD